MFDFGIGYTELVVVAIIAVIVIGPKDLPKVLRAFGKTMGKMRGMAREFQGHLDQAMREAGVDEIKKEVKNLKTGIETQTNSIKTAAAGTANAVGADVKKADDDFKKMFGEGAGKTTEPTA
jgi:sec-independent protein translocase protein TatB